jgi:hypothetical protein
MNASAALPGTRPTAHISPAQATWALTLSVLGAAGLAAEFQLKLRYESPAWVLDTLPFSLITLAWMALAAGLAAWFASASPLKPVHWLVLIGAGLLLSNARLPLVFFLIDNPRTVIFTVAGCALAAAAASRQRTRLARVAAGALVAPSVSMLLVLVNLARCAGNPACEIEPLPQLLFVLPRVGIEMAAGALLGLIAHAAPDPRAWGVGVLRLSAFAGALLARQMLLMSDGELSSARELSLLVDILVCALITLAGGLLASLAGRWAKRRPLSPAASAALGAAAGAAVAAVVEVLGFSWVAGLSLIAEDIQRVLALYRVQAWAIPLGLAAGALLGALAPAPAPPAATDKG